MVNISVILKEKVYLDLDDVTWAREEDITSSKEPEFSNLPRTWKEFCDKYPVQANEHYIDKGQAVDYNAFFGDKYNHNRFEFQDSGLLPNKETCEAVLALCKLIQLMHCYNNSVQSKNYTNNYCTLGFNSEGSLSLVLDAAPIFYFKNNMLRSKFIENFRDLLETIKPLFKFDN